jgi:hypothetical protein
VAFESITRVQLRERIARHPVLRDHIAGGTATAGGAATLTDTNKLVRADAGDFIGCKVFISAGTSAGDERNVTASTAAGQLTVDVAFTASPTTSSVYELHRRYDVTEYNQVIDDALRSDRMFHMSPRRVVNVLTNNLLSNPLFHLWTAGTTSPPDDWTLDNGAVLRVSSPIRGIYSARVVGDGSDGKLSQDSTLWDQRYFETNELTLTARVYISDVDWNVQIEIIEGDSGTTVKNSGGSLGWQELTVSHTFAETNNLASDTVREVNVNGNTGSSDYFAVDSMHLGTLQPVKEYEIPPEVHSVSRVWIQRGFRTNGEVQNWRPLRVGLDYDIIPGNISPLHVLTLHEAPPGNVALAIEGMLYSAVPTADTSVIGVNSALIQKYALAELASNADQRAAYMELRNTYRVPYRPNSIVLEQNE